VTTYINVGAKNRDGVRYASKKALRTALAEDPSEVLFDRTSYLQDHLPAVFCGDALPDGATLVVAGPDPYEKRNWFANVVQTASGTKVT
jgi:hypothetical protein